MNQDRHDAENEERRKAMVDQTNENALAQWFRKRRSKVDQTLSRKLLRLVSKPIPCGIIEKRGRWGEVILLIVEEFEGLVQTLAGLEFQQTLPCRRRGSGRFLMEHRIERDPLRHVDDSRGFLRGIDDLQLAGRVRRWIGR